MSNVSDLRGRNVERGSAPAIDFFLEQVAIASERSAQSRQYRDSLNGAAPAEVQRLLGQAFKASMEANDALTNAVQIIGAAVKSIQGLAVAFDIVGADPAVSAEPTSSIICPVCRDTMDRCLGTHAGAQKVTT
jgi:hypothetical protein